MLDRTVFGFPLILGLRVSTGHLPGQEQALSPTVPLWFVSHPEMLLIFWIAAQDRTSATLRLLPVSLKNVLMLLVEAVFT